MVSTGKVLLIALIAILATVNGAYAGTIQAFATHANTHYSFITGHSLTSQTMINIPQQALNNTQSIDTIKLFVGRTTSTAPDGNLIVRIYSQDIIHSYHYLDSYAITPAQHNTACSGDWACLMSISLTSDITIDPNTDYAIGIYSTNTVGDWYLLGDYRDISVYVDPTSYNWFKGISAINTGVQEYISNVLYTPMVAYLDDNLTMVTIKYIPTSIYGQSIIPQTPIPTPTTTGTPGGTPIPAPNDSAPPAPGVGGIPSGNFSNTSQNCPTCQGNETVTPGEGGGYLPGGTNGTGAAQVMKGLGYCNSMGCTIDDFIDMFYDTSAFAFVLSLIYILVKCAPKRQQNPNAAVQYSGFDRRGGYGGGYGGGWRGSSGWSGSKNKWRR